MAGGLLSSPLADFPSLIHAGVHRPREQGWMSLRPLAKIMARPGL